MKKNKKIIIAIIVFAVLILAVGIALAVVLKNNNKEEFFKYASQIFDSENGFIDNKIEKYNQKKSSESFENTGKITVNVPTDDIDSKTANVINNSFNISFMGNVDEPNQKIEQLFKINYDKDNSFPILYKKVEDVQAVKLSKIMKKYLGMDFSEDNQLSSIGIDTNMLNSFEFTAEEKEKIKNEYLPILKNNVEEKNFSKVSTSDASGYVLEIQNDKLQEILVKILDKLKEDNQLLAKFNIKANWIDMLINNLKLNDGKTSITVYHKDKKLNRIIIELDNIKLDIKKIELEDELSYDINVTSSNNNNDILAKVVIGFSGLNSLENVNETYSLGIDLNGNSYTYNIENSVNFTDVEIKDFKENELVDLNKMSQENLAKNMQTIIERFNAINIELMEKASIKPENFWNNFVPKFNTSANIDDEDDEDDEDEANELLTDKDDKEEEEETSEEDKEEKTESEENKENDSSKKTSESDGLASAFSETEKKTFNSKYTAYEGDEVKGSNVKTLIMQIIANNMADEERQIKVTGDVKLTGNEVPESLDTSKTYAVTFKKSDDGYVNEAKIAENE